MPTTLSDLPTITVEIAFATDPAATPTWSDVSTYVRAVSIRRGRNDELQRIEAGTARLVLSNRDRRFDPSHTTGAYYPNVLPMRKIRIRATWSAVTYDLFTGYIERWPQNWKGQSDAFVTIEAVDGFEPLAQALFSLETTQQYAGARIGAVLDEIGWSATDRDIDTGQSEIIAESLSEVAALQHLNDVALSERGYVFMSGDGKLTYHDRHRRMKGDYIVSQATFGDQGSELPYKDLKIEFDKDRIKNHVSVTRSGGSNNYLTEDTNSQDSYFRRSYAISPKLVSDVEAEDLSYFLLSQYKEPLLEVRSISLEGRMSGTALWPKLLGFEIGDRITVKRTPPGGGSRISTDNHLEGITHDIQSKGKGWSWITKWDLSAADPIGYWILADSTYGVLDTTTRLAF